LGALQKQPPHQKAFSLQRENLSLSLENTADFENSGLKYPNITPANTLKPPETPTYHLFLQQVPLLAKKVFADVCHVFGHLNLATDKWVLGTHSRSVTAFRGLL